MRFNTLQVNRLAQNVDIALYTLDTHNTNKMLDEVYMQYKEVFKREKINNIAFTKDGFCGLFLTLKGKIAVSLGESEYIVEGARKAKSFGVDIEFIQLNNKGTIDLNTINDIYDFMFISSYVVDTYSKIDLEILKANARAKIISNATVELSPYSDIYILDSYKLCSLGAHGVIIFNDEFEENIISQIDLLTLDLTLQAYKMRAMNSEVKVMFLEHFKSQFKDELFFFVDPRDCLGYTLHLGLKGIKMRELIKTLVFDEIYITNGEGCSLGFSRPSRILQEMGFSEEESRCGLSLDFSGDISVEDIKTVVTNIYKKYKQIKVLG